MRKVKKRPSLTQSEKWLLAYVKKHRGANQLRIATGLEWSLALVAATLERLRKKRYIKMKP
jgi:DNA-binding MarR family transcriptional regulator